MTRPLLRQAVLGTTTVLAAAVASLVAPTTAQAASGHYAGVLLSPGGKPVPGVFVSDGNDLGLSGTTDADGRFDFAPHGITAPILLCAALTQDSPQGGAAGWTEVCAYVKPGIKQTLRFQPGAAVSGVVTDARTGDPVVGAPVTLLDGTEPVAARTDANGRYVYRNLRPGPHDAPDLEVGAPATPDAPYGYAVTDTDTLVNLPAGQVRSDLGFTALPRVRYSGTVVDAGGTPVAKAHVVVQTTGNYPSATADAGGKYEVLAPWGGAEACVWGGRSTAHPTGLAVTCAYIGAPNGTAVSRRLVTGGPGGAVAGKIRTPDGSNGGAITATVTVALPTGNFDLPGVVTDHTYRVDGLPANVYNVRVSVPGFTGPSVAYSRSVNVAANTVTTVPDVVVYTGGA